MERFLEALSELVYGCVLLTTVVGACGTAIQALFVLR